MAYCMCRKFEWNESKNQLNVSKHGIDFDTASYVFDDPHFMTEQDRVVDGEERWQTIGRVGGFIILMVAHTVQDAVGLEIIRIISARKATPKEQKRYEQTAFR